MFEGRGQRQLNRAAQKWRAFAEQRLAYLVDLHRNRRWPQRYSEDQFLHYVRGAADGVEKWTQVAPRSPERGPAPARPAREPAREATPPRRAN
jgi:uncharacterized repeat protein (TIGR03809 family)